MKLALFGDVMLGRLVNDALRRRPAEYPWGDVLPLLADADVRLCNLECVLSDGGRPWRPTQKAFHFRSDAKNVAVLQAAGIDAVALANNHTIDFGYGAMQDMFGLLDRAGIARAGAGMNAAEARQPAMLGCDGVRIGLIAFTDNEPQWEARDEWPGAYHVPTQPDDRRVAALLEHVQRTRRQVDLLILSAHWGGNWGREPPREHVQLGRALVEHGADVVYGHSCHVVRGVELHRGRPILYSTGDFVDDYAVDETERNDWSFVFVVDSKGGAIMRLRLYPTVIRESQARVADEPERSAIAERMAGLCGELGTQAAWRADAACLEIPVNGSRP